MPQTDSEHARLVLSGRGLSVEDVVAVARSGRRVGLAPEAADRMRRSRAVVDRLLAEGAVVYGVTTGFGDLANVRIDPSQSAQLQRNLLRSHAAGVGTPLPRDVVRAMLVLRANCLAIGLSGVRVELAELLCDMVNAGIEPRVPRFGSVGASGDLAPLAHLGLVVMGEGEVERDGMTVGGADALRAADLAPLELQAKEGLALLNGTQLMAAVAALVLHDAQILVDTADLVGAMTLDAVRGTDAAFADELQEARPHPGQGHSALNLRLHLRESEIGRSHRSDLHRVQDAYSLRCMPQVHGAVRDALGHLRRVLDIEMNSVTDNPLVMPASDRHPEGDVVSGGNFHGAPLAIAIDLAKIALAELASISERRTARLLDAHLSELPPFLTAGSGLSSGLMIAQYTAAALVNELQTLAHPSSVDTVPTSANQEDHVSMGATGALHLLEVADRTSTVLAIEALCAAQGLDFRAPLTPGRGVAAAHRAVREKVPHLDDDRPPAPDIAAVLELVRDGALVQAAADA